MASSLNINNEITESESDKAFNYIIQGKRHLLINDYESAVESFQEASRILADKYGELATECGEAYFLYGKSLLELARIESDVLGNLNNKLSDNEESEDDPEMNDIEDNSENISQSNVEENNDKVLIDVNDCENNNNCDSISKDDTEKIDSECDTPNDAQDALDSSRQDNDGEEDVTNIQLAWEMLELAKHVYEKNPNQDQAGLKLSEVYLKLGEVSIESENYTQSIADLDRCLEIQKSLLEPHSRLIAETYYNKGVAYSLANDFISAIESFNNAIDVIRSKIVYLETHPNNDTESDNDNTKIDEEIDNLRKLIPDITEKIDDMRQMHSEVQNKLREFIQNGVDSSKMASLSDTSPVKLLMSSGGDSSTSSATKVDEKNVSCINHLVKRRITLEDAAPNGSDNKKQKCESEL